METTEILRTREKPKFVKNKEAMKEIEMVTESIPQLILQIYIFNKKNDIFNIFTSSLIFYEFYKSAQIRSIITSTFSIIFGLVGIYGYKAFYFYEQKIILLGDIRHPEKGLFQKIGRFISLFLWYFSVVYTRVLLIVLMLSDKKDLILPLILISLFKSLILNILEKNYFEEKKFTEEFERKTSVFRKLYSTKNGSVDIEKLIYYKPKSVFKTILSFFYMIFGVYENIFINIEYHSNTFYIPRQTMYYLIFYILFYIQNLIFAFVLYFGFNNNSRIKLFYVFTFAIPILIQILYRKIDIVEKVNFYAYFYLLKIFIYI
jgi:hypothetical protein